MDPGLLGTIGTYEPDEKPDDMTAGILGHPRGPREVLEPEAWQRLMDAATAPRVVDPGHDPGVVGLDRSVEPDPVGHRAASQATTPAVANSTGMSGP